MSDFLSFKLPDDFVASYATRPVAWGYTDAGGNSLGEITFLAKYSRVKEDGTKERWHEVCRRVIEGMFSIQKDHAKANRLPWNDHKAQVSAQEAYDRMFGFKWLPPGRGLWTMGTNLVNGLKNSAALQNCAFVSTNEMTKRDPAKPFAFLMEASMLGVGVGFDDKGADKGFHVHRPSGEPARFTVPDTREGWVESMRLLVNSYLKPDLCPVVFDYSEIRPAGAPIQTFGGTAAGPGPLQRLHESLRLVLNERVGQELTRTDVADIGNLIGVCVVAGNVRRSAELLIGHADDEAFINLKNAEHFPRRNSYDPAAPGWAWMSNNSVEAHVGQDLTHLVDAIATNGEPGVIWMDVSRQYGRIADGPTNADYRVAGYNPCAEQSLESGEMCTLVETFLNRHDDLADFKRTLKFAFMYAKTVTLLPTHWQETNAIMLRNRRIGTGISGVANFADKHGLPELREWMDEGYQTVRRYDRVYSEWLCVRESIKVTTVKPSGTVSILAGESPGVHWAPGGKTFLRAQRFAKDHPLVPLLRWANYTVEPAAEDAAGTVVAYFPIHTDAERADDDVSLFEKANLAAQAQTWWSDNSVSVTLSFDKERESHEVGTVLRVFEGRLKTVSFLPQGNTVYPQMPYTRIAPAVYEDAKLSLMPIDLTPLYDGTSVVDAEGEEFCTTDACEVRTVRNTHDKEEEL